MSSDADEVSPGRTEQATAVRGRRRPSRRPRALGDDLTVITAREHEERLTARLAQQWSVMREQRRAELDRVPVAVVASPTDPTAAGVPRGVDLAAGWAWRFLVIVAAGYVIVRSLGYLEEVMVPIAIALLLAALVSPVVRGLTRLGLPQGPASLVTVLVTLGFVALLLTLAGQQIASGADDLATSTAQGLGEIRSWLSDGPLNLTNKQVNDYIQQGQDAINKQVAGGKIAGKVTEIGTVLTRAFAGLFIVLFSTYFFLADGDKIWAFLVRLAPRAARPHMDSSGRVAWISLTQFVRATVIVAGTDAIGTSVGAAILQVPFVLAIGVLVFLGAFVPLVGAFVAGGVAVLVALVAQGPFTALLMLAVVVGVQQLEAHVLQPFLMGRWVSVHPLAVILAIAVGVLVAGIVGALIAVPLTAVVNAVVSHLAGSNPPPEDPVEDLAEEYADDGTVIDVDDGGAAQDPITGDIDVAHPAEGRA